MATKVFKSMLMLSCAALMVVSLSGCDDNGRGGNKEVDKYCGFLHFNNPNCK